MTISKLINGIQGTDAEAEESAARHWAGLAKPLGGLGQLEQAVIRMAGVTGTETVTVENPVLLVFCADNGVVAQGVSQSDSSVTTAVAESLGKGTSTVNHMAQVCGCRVVPVNIGMKDTRELDGVRNCCIRRGTGDIVMEAAMSREECEKAILTGVDLVREQKEKGAKIILLGEMGIGNTTTSAALSCALLKKEAEGMIGRGAGLSDAGLLRKKEAVQEALRLHAKDSTDTIGLLAALGGLDLAALCGACLGGAYYRVPVLLDGVITCAAALCAARICPKSRTAMLASHVSEEPAARLLLEDLDLAPFIRAGLHLGEGTGAMLALSLLQQTLAVYDSGHTFDCLGIDAYTPQ